MSGRLGKTVTGSALKRSFLVTTPDNLQSYDQRQHLAGNLSDENTPPPPLSAERVAQARLRHGHAVDLYLKYLRTGDPILDALVLHNENVPRSEGYDLFLRALRDGIDSVKNPSPPLVKLFKELDYVPFWVDRNRMRIASKKIIRNGLLTSLSFATYALPHTYLATCNKPLTHTRTC